MTMASDCISIHIAVGKQEVYQVTSLLMPTEGRMPVVNDHRVVLFCAVVQLLEQLEGVVLLLWNRPALLQPLLDCSLQAGSRQSARMGVCLEHRTCKKKTGLA